MPYIWVNYMPMGTLTVYIGKHHIKITQIEPNTYALVVGKGKGVVELSGSNYYRKELLKNSNRYSDCNDCDNIFVSDKKAYWGSNIPKKNCPK